MEWSSCLLLAFLLLLSCRAGNLGVSFSDTCFVAKVVLSSSVLGSSLSGRVKDGFFCFLPNCLAAAEAASTFCFSGIIRYR